MEIVQGHWVGGDTGCPQVRSAKTDTAQADLAEHMTSPILWHLCTKHSHMDGGHAVRFPMAFLVAVQMLQTTGLPLRASHTGTDV